jgi:OFA family oxalate/formate antiporter-like MFS transporter
MSPATKSMLVVAAGLGLALALGSLATLALVGAELLRPLSAGGVHGWSVRQVSVPFATAFASFLLAMIVGGGVQDRIGPRWPSTTGGVLMGLGMILASMSDRTLAGPGPLPLFMIVGLGLMLGGGAGLTFASVVPPLVKWSAPRHRGLVVGLAVGAFALGPAWLNETAGTFVRQRGVSSVLLAQGIALLAVVVLLSQLLDNPLVGFVPPGSYSDSDGLTEGPVPWTGMPPRRMLVTATFRSLLASGVLLSAASAFLAVVLVLGRPSHLQLGAGLILAVALGGCFGGVGAGFLHDRIGAVGQWPVAAFLATVLAAGAALISMGYSGAAATLVSAGWTGSVVIPWVSTIKCFGTRSAGANFGLVWIGWSLGLLVGSFAAVVLVDARSLPTTAPGANVSAAVALVAVLGTAVLLSARVRPDATRSPADAGRGSPHRRVEG